MSRSRWRDILLGDDEGDEDENEEVGTTTDVQTGIVETPDEDPREDESSGSPHTDAEPIDVENIIEEVKAEADESDESEESVEEDPALLDPPEPYHELLHDGAALYEAYHIRHWDTQAIADYINATTPPETATITTSRISDALEEHNILARGRGARYPALHDRKHLAKRLVVDDLSAAELADEVGCSPSTVHRHIRQHDLDVDQLRENLTQSKEE